MDDLLLETLLDEPDDRCEQDGERYRAEIQHEVGKHESNADILQDVRGS